MLSFLFIHWHVNPVIFQLGGFGLRWYSLLFVSGFILGWYIFRWFFRREGVSEDLLEPLLLTLFIGTIVGARLGHCLFYQPDYYLGSWEGFWEIFMPWKGGLASHGGALMLILCMIWFAHKYGKSQHFDFWWLTDHLCIATAFAAAAIRIGNLFNSEIYGVETSLPWGFVFDLRGETVPKHPTQIYEALTYLILGLVLVGLYKWKLPKMPKRSFLGIFMIVCFGMRFMIEFIKEDQVAAEAGMALNLGQKLSIPFVLFGVWLIVEAFRKRQPAYVVHPEKEKKAAGPMRHVKPLAK